MSATDELRRLLDERGVEWHQDERQGWYFTEWDGRYGRCNAMEWHPTLTVMMPNLTPEQAIEATLGRGTCRNVGESMLFVCSECGCVVNNRTHTERVFEIPDYGDEYWADKRPLRYCPNCGARVVER